MNLELSVVICAHNPRREYLERVINALKKQSLPRERWELVIIDNASKDVLADHWDLSWHPRSRHVREMECGLVPARLRGITESSGDVIVFVDDDNLLRDDYLEASLKISKEWPQLGAWGGKIEAEFEEEPAPELVPLVPLLAIRKVDKIAFSNSLYGNHAMPCGAGMVVRRSVAECYAGKTRKNRHLKSLDRVAGSLASGGDTDLAMTACDCGLGTGLFPTLFITHLIPARRIKAEYLFKLSEEVLYGHSLLSILRGEKPPKITLRERVSYFYSLMRLRSVDRSVFIAHRRAKVRLSKLKNNDFAR